MEKFIWLSYDLGIKGDYQGIYSWLDDHGAKECGDSVAALPFSYEGGDFLEAVKADLEAEVSLDRHSRIYVVWMEERRVKGRFLVGKRRRSPWAGYGTLQEEYEDEG